MLLIICMRPHGLCRFSGYMDWYAERGWHGVFVGEWLFVFPLCGFSLSLFCNYWYAERSVSRLVVIAAESGRSPVCGLVSWAEQRARWRWGSKEEREMHDRGALAISREQGMRYHARPAAPVLVS